MGADSDQSTSFGVYEVDAKDRYSMCIGEPLGINYTTINILALSVCGVRYSK